MGKERVRITKTGHAYTPQRTVNYESLVALAAQEAMRGKDIVTGPVKLALVAAVPVAKSWPKKRREAALEGREMPTGKPDIDNMVKAIADGMNGVVWVDDAQIVTLAVQKVYSETPGVAVFVEAA